MHQNPPAYAPSRPSATVVLIRDAKSGPQMLLVLRHAKSSFGASYVFPGGVLEATDDLLGNYCTGLNDADANAALGTTAGGASYFSGAIRELFEEAGILLARTRQGAWADPGRFAIPRNDLNAGILSWADFVQKNELILAYDQLHYFSFWITPRELPKRFSTRFFVAALPNGQVATHCGGELTDSRWFSASGAIAASEAGKILLPQPTVSTLRDLSGFPTIDSILNWAGERSTLGVSACRPALISIDGHKQVVMPDSPDYPLYPDAR